MDTRRASIEAGTPSKLSLTERLDEGMQRGFEWVIDNSRTVVAVLVGALVIGGGVAGVYEWIQARRAAAFDALASVERTLEKALAASQVPATETANPEIAQKARDAAPELEKKAREDAIAGFDAVIADHSGSVAAFAAALRAARLEIALGRLDAADKRLEELAKRAGDDVARAAALRLRGYVLEETDRAEQAAELYAQVGGIESYPGRIQSYVQAAETYERIGKIPAAIEALEKLSVIAPEYAEQADILSQLETLRARLAREGGAKPSP